MISDTPETNLHGRIGFLETVDRVSDLFNGFSFVGVIPLDNARARDLGAVVSDPGEAFRGELAVGVIRTAEDITLEADQISLLLNSNLTTLKGIDMTLACVCLAQTCFSMTNVQSVRIMAESFDGRIGVDQTIHINSLLLEDLPQSSE